MTQAAPPASSHLDHETLMARAIGLARRGWNTTTPNPRVGCVLERDGEIVGEGWHVRAGEGHAEINALNAAGDKASGATAYITLEPCNHQGRTGPCSQALIDAGVSSVIVAMLDPNPKVSGSGIDRLRAAGIAVQSGVQETQAQNLNPGYIKRMRDGSPFVTCKVAMSVDGRTAMASGESQWITGTAARTDVQRLRAESCAVLTGAGTVLVDNPMMTVRDPVTNNTDGLRQPLRVVADSKLRCNPQARIFTPPGNCILVHGVGGDAEARQRFAELAPEVELVAQAGAQVDLPALMSLLAERECNGVLLECGAVLAGAMLEQQLIDQLVVYMAPVLLGSDARPLLHLPLQTMQDKVPLQIADMRAVGDDWRITITPTYA